jgi:hypothetical protein
MPQESGKPPDATCNGKGCASLPQNAQQIDSIGGLKNRGESGRGGQEQLCIFWKRLNKCVTYNPPIWGAFLTIDGPAKQRYEESNRRLPAVF